MTLPHDYYLKFLTDSVLDDTLVFHSKGNYTITHATKHFTILHHIPKHQLSLLTGNELPLNTLPRKLNGLDPALSPLVENHPLKRNHSCQRFSKNIIAFENIKMLLAPLLTKIDSNYKRGYPSGGALYPIEAFICPLRKIPEWPAENEILHLNARSRTLESYRSQIDTQTLTNSLLPDSFDLGSPAVAIVYCMYLPKALFKYRYRGYRLALMEAGSMYMLCDLRCKELNLDSRLWSGFSDHQVTKALGLNPTLFLPTCIQFIG